MAEPKENLQMEKIVSLCKRRGFIFQSSEIYGGINGFWDYGPLGAELKRNIKDLWWTTMTRQRDDVAGLEATIIMSPEIWRASGHVATFSDPMCDCLLTKKRFRADQIEPQSGTVHSYTGAVNRIQVKEFYEQSLLHNQIYIGEGIANAYQIGDDQKKRFLKTSLGKEEMAEVEFLKFVLAGDYHSTATIISKLFDGTTEESVSFLNLIVPQKLNEFSDKCMDSYSVLLPPGKPKESARKVALQFYQQRGVKDPFLLEERTERVENSTRFNPENGSLLTDPRPFNLMFKTYVGPVESEEGIAYLRPETAQAIFAQFKNVLDTSRQKVPFGICQIGKAFRNEVTPRNFTFRSREFEQMKLEFFIKPDEAIEAIIGSVTSAP
ncbi:MAG: glycine--tRNA ligase, partial [Akkermansiaceae bacterium]|nr:glycine--tRNA ligase [Verrucomicrobiales bacterium]